MALIPLDENTLCMSHNQEPSVVQIHQPINLRITLKILRRIKVREQLEMKRYFSIYRSSSIPLASQTRRQVVTIKEAARV